jgi:hypothetical protein
MINDIDNDADDDNDDDDDEWWVTGPMINEEDWVRYVKWRYWSEMTDEDDDV